MKKIAVMLPCHNEASTIAHVVNEVRLLLPEAQIYVYDNNSTDDTAQVVMKTSAILKSCPTIGKGNVVHQMLREIDADYYVMIDGDHTYDVIHLSEWIERAIKEEIDMLVGKRRQVFRKLHGLGNTIFNFMFRQFFNCKFQDIFSGYRIMSRKFVKSFVGNATGFQIETELSLHCVLINARWLELDVEYHDRTSGSKLSTFKDGAKIAAFMILRFLEFRPIAAGLLALLSIILLGAYSTISVLALIAVCATNYNISMSRIENRKLIYKSIN